MDMLSATERGRPILEYVHQLEGKVRAYRQEERQFNLRCFFAGFAWGAVSVGAGWALFRLLHT